MILLFRIISDEDQEFYRDLVIDSSDTFLDFHNSLQNDLGYDPSQLASFFITTGQWEKLQEITLIDMLEDPELETLTMGEVSVGEFVKQISQRLIYVFDFFLERSFFIELIESTHETSPRDTPFVAGSRGKAPPQLNLDLLSEEPGSDEEYPGYSDNYDTDMFDDIDFPDPDDLDPDAYDNDFPEES